MGFIKISCCWCHRDSGCTSLDVVISTKKKLFKKSLKFKREKHFKANRPFLLPSFYCSRKKLFNYAQLKSWQERCNLISFNKSLQFHRRWRKSFFYWNNSMLADNSSLWREFFRPFLLLQLPYFLLMFENKKRGKMSWKDSEVVHQSWKNKAHMKLLN